jgi:hypothetical protein
MTTPRVNPEMAAYFAGLFDGEGWIRVEVKRGEHGGTGVLCVGLGSTFLAIVTEMHQTFGGCLTKIRIPSKVSRKPMRDWRATNEVAADFLRVVYPYLRIKKRQAALAFKFRNIMGQTLHKRDAHRIELFEEISAEISTLNKSWDGLVETVKPTPETAKSQSTAPLFEN